MHDGATSSLHVTAHAAAAHTAAAAHAATAAAAAAAAAPVRVARRRAAVAITPSARAPIPPGELHPPALRPCSAGAPSHQQRHSGGPCGLVAPTAIFKRDVVEPYMSAAARSRRTGHRLCFLRCFCSCLCVDEVM